jgi:threonine/homoserine/homoserine lactone efflux protein
MPEPGTLALFAAAALALLLIPGPSVIYIVTRTVAQGRSAGLTSVLGVHVGSVAHVAAAALGLSAILASSAMAFSVVKYLGAVYLIWLGLRQLLRRPVAVGAAAPTALRSRRRLFGDGVLVNVLNPKTAIFFLAFLPQFADPSRGPIAVQVVVLGACFIGLGMLSDSGYALLAGAVSGRVRNSVAARRRLDRASGVVYLGLGAGAALTGRHP